MYCPARYSGVAPDDQHGPWKYKGKLTDWYGTLKYLEPDLAPLADRLELDTAVDQGLSQISPTGPEGVGADSDGSGGLVGLEESDSLKISYILQDISLY